MLVPLPPPIHGASLMSQQLVHSSDINRLFRLRVIPLRFASKLKRLGKFSPGKVFLALALTVRLLRELLFYRPKLAYMVATPSGYSHYRDFGWILLLRLFRVHRLLHVRERGFGVRANRWTRWRYRSLFSGAHAIVLSPLLKSDLAELVEPERLHAVPNGLPDIPPSGKEPPLSRKKKTILFLSNLMVNKGIYVLLDAASRLKAQKLDFHLVLAGAYGRDINAAQLEARIGTLGLEDNVEIRGPVDEAAKAELLDRALLLVFPTLKEAFGNVLLEAMRAGLPVVASREGSIPWIVIPEETGIVFPPGDAAALAAGIRRLLADPDLRNRLGAAGRERFHREFTDARFEARMIRLLKTCSGSEWC